MWGMHPVVVRFAAVVLAGGRGSRLGGVDKVALRVGGRSLLDRTLDAVADAESVVVVGPRRPATRDVVWTAEEPPGGGPLAGLSAGLAAVPAGIGLVAVLAADYPYLTPSTVSRLLSAVDSDPTAAGAVLADSGGRLQWLVGVWRADLLRRDMPEEVQNRPVRDLLRPLDPIPVSAHDAEASDVDTADDLRSLDG